jgi:hypothetical protein
MYLTVTGGPVVGGDRILPTDAPEPGSTARADDVVRHEEEAS